MKITRRDAINHGGKALAAAAVLPVAILAKPVLARDDSALLRDVALWHECEKDITALLAQRREREAGLPEGFLNRFDPRGWEEINEINKDWPVARRERLREYERAFVRGGLGAINDRLGDLWDRQDPITQRVIEATPTTLAGALGQISVCLVCLAGLHVSPGDDFSVKTVETANRALSNATRMAQGGAP